MRYLNRSNSIRSVMLVFISILLFSACDRSSSPEGRMSIKLENVQKEMIDSLKQQNRAILDSLGKILEELNELKQLRK